MKLIENIKNIYSIFRVDGKILYGTKSEIFNYETLKKINISVIGNIRKNSKTIANIKENLIEFYDADLNEINSFRSKDITFESGLDLFSKDNFVIHNFIDSDNLVIVSDRTIIKKIDNFWGNVINEQYLLYFKEYVFNSPTYFRCANLLDETTYFEYQCEQKEKVIGGFKLFDEKLLFHTRETEKETYDSKFWINVLNVKTGKTIYKVLVEHYGACFDYNSGKFVSIQGTNQNNKITKKYEIVNVNNGTVEKDTFNFSQDMFAVGTAVQYINDDKLYFVDNVYSHKEQKRKSPKIGCFDVVTKQITFFEELKEAEGFSIDQIINKDDMVYAKTDNNELFVLEI